MARLVWDKIGKRFYETGVDRGVLYPVQGPGVVWNGIVSINEDSSGGDVNPFHFDGVKYLDVVSSEDFQATLQAFSAPSEFASCCGVKSLSPGLYATNQPRKTFGLSYRTLIGNDVDGDLHGYKLHLVYNATASSAGISSQTLDSSSSINARQWTIFTVPELASEYKPTAHLVLDSTEIDKYMLEDVESVLYGRPGEQPRLPSQDEVLLILANRIEEPIFEPI